MDSVGAFLIYGISKKFMFHRVKSFAEVHSKKVNY